MEEYLKYLGMLRKNCIGTCKQLNLISKNQIKIRMFSNLKEMRRAIVVILIVSMSLNVVVGWAVEDESIDFESEQPIQIEDIMESSEDIKTEESDEPNIEDELDEQDVVDELDIEEENIDSDELDVEDKTIIEEVDRGTRENTYKTR